LFNLVFYTLNIHHHS
jgi:hypothetical protein